MRKRVVVLTAMVAGGLHVSSPSALAQAARVPQARAGRSRPSSTPRCWNIRRTRSSCASPATAASTRRSRRIVARPSPSSACAATRTRSSSTRFTRRWRSRSGAATVPRVSCKDCHGTHDVASPKVAGSKFSAGRVTESCGKCHKDEAAIYRGVRTRQGARLRCEGSADVPLVPPAGYHGRTGNDRFARAEGGAGGRLPQTVIWTARKCGTGCRPRPCSYRGGTAARTARSSGTVTRRRRRA